MWLLQLMLLSFVIGSVAGLIWRYIEDWSERRSNKPDYVVEMMGGEVQDDGATITPPATISPPVNPVSTTKSN
jgi:hypothetical protein